MTDHIKVIEEALRDIYHDYDNANDLATIRYLKPYIPDIEQALKALAELREEYKSALEMVDSTNQTNQALVKKLKEQTNER